MSNVPKIFTPENIKRLRAMKAIGADRHVMALAVGSKNANSFSARASKLRIFREQPADANQQDEAIAEAAAA
jgi:hypothetical protein